MDVNYASRGVGNTALGLSIGAVAAELLGGGLNGILGGRNCSSDDHCVNRYEAAMQKELTNKDMEIAYLKSRDAAKTDSLEVYRYIDGKIACVERELADQRTYNAVNTASINCIQGQVNQLLSLTALKIPNSSVCPGWDTASTAG